MADDEQRQSPLGMALACEVGLGVAALAVGQMVGVWPLERFAWSALAVGQGLLATLPLVIVLWLVTRWPVGPLKPLQDLVRELIVPLFAGVPVWQLAVISIAAGWGEELLFRGLIQAGAESRSDSTWFAVIVASAIFGLAHRLSTAYVIMAAAIGAYFGWLFIATENLLPAILAHAAYDFVALVYLLGHYAAPTSPAPPIRDVRTDDPQ
jgi:membrane protease YdiL (CAAX protease family)